MVRGAVALTLLGAAAGCAFATTVRVNFDELDASGGPIPLFTIPFWLFDRNIDSVGWRPNTDLGVYDAASTSFPAQGHVIAPTAPNVLAAWLAPDTDPSVGLSFLFHFRTPLTRLDFVRPAVLGQPDAPFEFPAWSVRVFDESQANELATFAEQAIIATTTVDKRRVSLHAPPGSGISWVRWDAGSGGTARLFAIDELVLELMAVPAPSSACGAFGAAWFTCRRRRARAGAGPARERFTWKSDGELTLVNPNVGVCGVQVRVAPETFLGARGEEKSAMTATVALSRA